MKLRMLALVAICLFPIMEVWAQSAVLPKQRILVAYYSLRNGNTRIIAEQIQQAVGGDVCRIETLQAYPANYRAVTEQAKQELERGVRPALRGKMPDLSKYDVVYLGSPNWWETIALAVMTFLDGADFSGKIIIPFVRHEGSRLGNSVDDIRSLALRAKLLEGIAIRGGSVNGAGDDVHAWLRKISDRQ